MKKYCRFYELQKTGANILGEVNFSLTRDEEKELVQYMVINVREEFNPDRKWKALTDFFEFSKSLNHPSILPYEVWGECRDGKYVAAKCREFYTLTATLQNLKKRNLPFSFDIPIQTIIQILSGLQYLSSFQYKGTPIYHNLLSPDEIMIGLDGVVYILNYGILQVVYEVDRKLARDLIMERATFLAPELMEKIKPSPKADVYSVGTLLFYLLTGKHFSPEKDPDAQISRTPMLVEYEGSKQIPEGLQKILKKALTPEDMRYQNVDIFRSVLEEFITEEDITPTTFNLAYYMNNLFHDETLERQKLVKRESEKIPVEIVEEPVEVEAPYAEEEEKKKGFPVVPAIAAMAVVLIGIIIFLIVSKPSAKPTISQEELEKRINLLVEAKMKEKEAQLRKEYEERYGKLTQQQQEEFQKRLEEERKKMLQAARIELLSQIKRSQASATSTTAKSITPSSAPATQPSQTKQTAGEAPAVTAQQTKKPLEATQLATSKPGPQQPQEQLQPAKEKKTTTPTKAPVQQKPVSAKKESQVIPGSIVPISDLDSPLRIIKKVAPVMPVRARRLRIKGSVMASILINEKGDVIQVRIIRGTPRGYFEDEARKTLMKWKFTPPRKKGIGVKVWKVVTIKFQ